MGGSRICAKDEGNPQSCRQDRSLFLASPLFPVLVCLTLRGLTSRLAFRHGRAIRSGLLALQALLACWGCLLPDGTPAGLFAFDALTACWFLIWTFGLLSRHPQLSGATELFGGLGLLCHETAYAVICMTLCLAFWQRSRPNGIHPHGQNPHGQRPDNGHSGGWRLGLFAPAGCAAVALPSIPSLLGFGAVPGLAMLPALSEFPILAWSLFVPPLLVMKGMTWPLILIASGTVVTLLAPSRYARQAWPVLLLGLTLAARAGGLPDTALAGGEALVLALALEAMGRHGWSLLFHIPLPPLAGFLPLWLGLHVVNGLCSLSPAWTAGGMMLGLAIGLIMLRGWKTGWDRLAAGAGAGAGAGTGAEAGRNAAGSVSALTLGLILSVCPGLLIGLVHPALLRLSDAGPDIWRSWPIWSIAGGDGTFWYPAAIFLLPALLAPAILGTLPASLPPFPRWPVSSGLSSPALRLPWAMRRPVVLLRRRYAGTVALGHRGATARAFAKTIARAGVILWIVVLAMALAWLGWTS
ncbi:hypothetical protein [Swaminathania salitolerans]|uniref:hypothetical protein n=1 Tax=Swaminathania salitolerans TaxID=182838 RepID=UPI0011BED3ED|nr:hypothetical protein [Swaminathania salitolerans]